VTRDRLRSSCDPLQSACYPAAIILPIRLRSACDHLRSPCVQSPHTPVRVVAPLWASGAQQGTTRKKGREAETGGRNSPRHRQLRVESPKRPIINRSAIQHPRRRWRDQLSTSLRATVGLGSNENRSHTLPSVCPACCGQHRRVAFSTLRSSEKSARPMLRSHRKGFRARCYVTFNTLSGKDAREATIGATEALTNGNARMFEIQPKTRPGGGGGGGRSVARPILDLLRHFRGPALQNLGGPAMKMFDRAQKQASRLSGGPAARWASCPLVRGLRRALTHRRAVSESWRGMLP
jgi:hypothetical protein